jgi:3-oxoacyl-[acyl-carrier protein] reductase
MAAMLVALVTGAGRGIGLATARRLAADGYMVGALDVDVGALEAWRADMDPSGGPATASIVPLRADVTDPAAIERAIRGLEDAARGPVEVLVNNAGVGGGGTFLETDRATVDRLLDVHLHGAMETTRLVLPGMLERGSGVIVNVLSDGLWHGRTSVAYTTAKGALLGFTRSLALEVAAAGVRVNAVAPGPVATRMLLDDDPDAIAAELASVPLGRALEPDEIAATIAFLCGPAGAAYIGAVLSPNGGTVMSA